MNRKLEEKIDAVCKMSIEELCKKFNCSPEEICVGDYIARNTNDVVCPYKVILGFANFEDSSVRSLGPLEVVYGKKITELDSALKDMKREPVYLGLNLRGSRIAYLGNLKKVYGTCALGNRVTSTGNLKFIGSNLYLNNTNITHIDSDLIIDGRLNVEYCELESLEKIKKVGTLYINSKSVKSFGEIESFKKVYIGKKCNERLIMLFESKFVKKQGQFVRRDLEEINSL